MKRWKSAGLWLAVFACAGLGGWGGRQWELQQARAAALDAAEPATPPRARVHMPISLSPANARAANFPLTREAAERAARAGVLRVALLDGTYYDVRIDHQTLDAQGHWSIAGHAKTRLGPQAMVLTYGERAVFGTLPLPDGRVLQVRTEHGRALIGSHAAFPQRVPRRTDSGKRADELNVESFAPGNTGSGVIGDTVNITVLGLYTNDLLALRDGDVDAIATEFAGMLAIANQAHMDSASFVRFENAGLRAAGTDFANNDTALAELARTEGVGEARNATGADLVTLLRPRGKTDTTCGAAFRAADRMARNTVTDRDGFSVVNVAPCGPYALAHELGHNLGNAHERDKELSEVGELRNGAHYYAFAHRTRTFATLDAEDGDLPVIGRFSNPLQGDCGGEACGIDDVADNVRSMQGMAAEVAAYRGVPGTISIADAIAIEPANGDGWARVPIRITGAAVDEVVTVAVVGGSAIPGVDFSPAIEQPLFNPGASEATVAIRLLADATKEGDETIQLRITRVDTTGATTIQRDTATLTIVDPPRVLLTGRVRGEGVVFPPDVEVFAYRTVGNDPLGNMAVHRTLAPDYTFSVPVVRGASVRLELPMADELYTAPVFVNDIRDQRYAELNVQNSVPVMITWPMGPGDGLLRWTYNVGRFPPVSQFASTSGLGGMGFTVPPGARLRVDVDLLAKGSQGRVFDNVRAPIDQLFQPATTPSVYVDAAYRSTDEGRAGETRTAAFVVRLSAPSATPVTVQYRTVDGTAKAGTDYVAASGVLTLEPGQTFVEVPVALLGDDKSEYPDTFELLIESATAAVISTNRLKMTIADDDLVRAGAPAIR
jgi:hypothetical protein